MTACACCQAALAASGLDCFIQEREGEEARVVVEEEEVVVGEVGVEVLQMNVVEEEEEFERVWCRRDDAVFTPAMTTAAATATRDLRLCVGRRAQ